MDKPMSDPLQDNPKKRPHCDSENEADAHDLLSPDFTVVAGGTEFRHYSQMLSCSSAYFNRLITAKMREGDEKRVEIADCCPEIWEVISSFFQPAALHCTTSVPPTIHQSNVEMLVPWFDRFMAKPLLKTCDAVFCQKVFQNRRRFCCRLGIPVGQLSAGMKKGLKAELDKLLDSSEFSATYSLSMSLERLCKEIGTVLSESPDLLDGRALEKIIILCVNYHFCAEQLWAPLFQHLPVAVRTDARIIKGPPHYEFDDSHFWIFCRMVEFGFEVGLQRLIAHQDNKGATKKNASATTSSIKMKSGFSRRW